MILKNPSLGYCLYGHDKMPYTLGQSLISELRYISRCRICGRERAYITPVDAKIYQDRGMKSEQYILGRWYAQIFVIYIAHDCRYISDILFLGGRGSWKMVRVPRLRYIYAAVITRVLIRRLMLFLEVCALGQIVGALEMDSPGGKTSVSHITRVIAVGDMMDSLL